MSEDATISPPETFQDNRGHKGPDRRCVGTGEICPKTQMVRFVKGPDNQLVPDIAGKLPGRGAWTLARRDALEAAIKTGGFKRGLKTNVTIGDDLMDQTAQLLRQKVLGLIPMALKAGQAYLGFDQVKSAARLEPLAWRIEASNGSEGGRGKIRVLTRAISAELGQKPTPVIGCFSSRELGQAFGRDELIHAAIKYGPMRASFDHAALRLSGFEPLFPENWPDSAHERGKNYVGKRGDKG